MVVVGETMRVTGVDWRLDVQYRDKSFSGKVSIGIEGASDPLVVDSAQLIIESATLDGQPIQYRTDAGHGTLEFSGISAQPHLIEIAYRGMASSSSLVGLYVSPAGSGYVLTTMMFPTGSRRLLPSFEHPAVKAVYRLTLTVDADVKTVFNTPIQSERLIDSRREIVFEPTPVMSAYLLYLGIGPFDILTVPGDRWSVTVAASPGRASAGQYCAERATELLAAYEEYYGVPYPLSKLDLVALESFWAGAMENWGAIAFRENAVLVDPTTSAQARRAILGTLSHEIAHQWFGNLVTPAWWDDFWLNESFATFVAHRIIDRRYPQEDTWSPFLVGWVGAAFSLDALPSTHSIHVPVDSPDSVGETADAVTYGKGGAVLRMIEAYLGEETFRRGVSSYLAKYRYANARAEDLWTELGRVSDLPVGRVMSEWVSRPGHPIIHAYWADRTLTLRQERFRADGARTPGQWPIPLTVVSSGGTTTTLFDGPELTLPMNTSEGLRINPGRTAFARTHFDPLLFDRMVEEFPSMSPVDQWGFVMDNHAFVYAGLTSPVQFLEIVRAATQLTEELPVRSIVAALFDLYRGLFDVPDFTAGMRQFLRVQLEAVGREGESIEPDSRRLLRELLALNLAQVDLEYARELAPRFSEFDRLSPELRGPVAISYARAEGRDAYEPLLTRLRSTVRENERVHMLGALGAFEDQALIRDALGLIPSPGVTPSGALTLLATTCANPKGRRELFAWYQDHSVILSGMWAGTPLHSVFLRSGLRWMGIDQEDEVRRYFAAHTPPEASQAVQQGLEALRLVTRLRRSVGNAGAM
jgi:tricorn protease interacting factor F2/3